MKKEFRFNLSFMAASIFLGPLFYLCLLGAVLNSNDALFNGQAWREVITRRTTPATWLLASIGSAGIASLSLIVGERVAGVTVSRAIASSDAGLDKAREGGRDAT